MLLVEEMNLLSLVCLNSRPDLDFHLDVMGRLNITLEFFFK